MYYRNPEELIPNGDDYAEINGVKVRKGTIASAMSCARVLELETSSEHDNFEAMKRIIDLVPDLKALEVD